MRLAPARLIKTALFIALFILIGLPVNITNANPFLVATTKPGTIPTSVKTSTPISSQVVITKSPTKAAFTRVKITLDLDIREFTKAEQDEFIKTLAQLLGIDPDQITIVRIEAGSIILTVDLPVHAAEKLFSLHAKNDASLATLHITEVVSQAATPTMPSLTSMPTYQVSTSVKTPTRFVTPTRPAISSPTVSTVELASVEETGGGIITRSSSTATIILLLLGGIFTLAILGVGGFLLLRPK